MSNSISDLPNSLVAILSFIMLLMGLMLSLARTVQQMIPYYKLQCISLAVVTLLTAFENYESRSSFTPGWVVGVLAIIPILLAIIIEPLLAQATVAENIPVAQRLMRALPWFGREQLRQQAMSAWLYSRRSRNDILVPLVVDLGLVAIAFITAFSLGESLNQMITTNGQRPAASIHPTVLAVSFSLLLLGITTMAKTEDIISQVIGLLVMEQGMFLAAVRFIPGAMRVYFILGLFLYIIITLTILVFLLPELHQQSGSLDVDQQTQLKG
jgi:hydrogenase-4 membrane subunit HyfE